MASCHHTRIYKVSNNAAFCCEVGHTLDFRFLQGSQAFELTWRFEVPSAATEPFKDDGDSASFAIDEQGCGVVISVL